MKLYPVGYVATAQMPLPGPMIMGGTAYRPTSVNYCFSTQNDDYVDVVSLSRNIVGGGAVGGDYDGADRTTNSSTQESGPPRSRSKSSA